jgi:hypothetical protein
MRKVLFPLFLLFTLNGCLEREIYTEISDRSAISHPPKSVKIEDASGMLKTSFKPDPSSPITMSVYIHCAKCTNAQSRSLGADFDGYIRITVSESNRTLARAQMDYKGEATREEIAQVFEHLMETLQWEDTLRKN